MYKYLDKLQHSFLDFNQPLGMHMNPENRWVRLVSDGKLMETQTANYFSDIYPIDCAVLSANA